jgi:hypothetical protein
LLWSGGRPFALARYWFLDSRTQGDQHRGMPRIEMTFLGVRRTEQLVLRAVASRLAASRARAGVAAETGGALMSAGVTSVISVACMAERPH